MRAICLLLFLCGSAVAVRGPAWQPQRRAQPRMASADEILRRSSPARPPTERELTRRAQRALQLGYAIRATTGEKYTRRGIQHECTRCKGRGNVCCGFCRGNGMSLFETASGAVHRHDCVVCQGQKRVGCTACGGSGRVASWALEMGALGDDERRSDGYKP
mmetsp:Transcript_22521/g.60921  ORF Transcript_22521/g.60921 Transcript_22521/m.60921 type:complete len:161 (-) Transcript_22521:397-879(-)